ncbi:hypothetical protein LEM8419_03460 [Neolewinella maritima]|uniref:Glucose/Sorbosone dehydrogenase domain-containing protein n=1 Tax=Neolewinella maritima TaxID=1383882 RepID=A0ABN8F7L8_9BACT|nr:PQQ-dependent sugar dehydrogenase [Neolewinella maritima]CAH1002586.1 hypothetical protein LEM8419_03460 [Neolewinella maritima]
MKNSYSLFAYLPLLFVLAGCQSSLPSESSRDNVSAADTSQPDSTLGSVALELLAEGFTNPLSMEQGPDGRYYVVDQPGVVYVIDTAGQLLDQPFLDLRDEIMDLKPAHEERGLLGLAFHPDYAANGRFFVHYSVPLRSGAPADYSHTKHLSEFRRDAADPLRADTGTERILLYVDEPQGNHNGGTLTFGPDGYLYLGLGDGGGANDTGTGHLADWYERNDGGNGQEQTQNLLGSIIRIDIDQGDPYGIPADNFLADREGVRETYATGLRNPYRFSFDRGGSNALFAADLGQDLWEEVDIIQSGGNYGWNVKEGTSCFNAASAKQPLADCPNQTPDGAPLIDPIVVLPHKDTLGYDGYGIAIIGGYVYRGGQFSELDGDYIFGMWTQHHDSPAGAIYTARNSGGGPYDVSEVSIRNAADRRRGRYINAFAQDTAGELYVLTSETPGPSGTTGKIYRMVPSSNYDYQPTEKSAGQQGSH